MKELGFEVLTFGNFCTHFQLRKIEDQENATHTCTLPLPPVPCCPWDHMLAFPSVFFWSWGQHSLFPLTLGWACELVTKRLSLGTHLGPAASDKAMRGSCCTSASLVGFSSTLHRKPPAVCMETPMSHTGGGTVEWDVGPCWGLNSVFWRQPYRKRPQKSQSSLLAMLYRWVKELRKARDTQSGRNLDRQELEFISMLFSWSLTSDLIGCKITYSFTNLNEWVSQLGDKHCLSAQD